MKKLIRNSVMVVAAILIANTSFGQTKFYASLTPGIAWSADGRNITKKSKSIPMEIEVGVMPKNYLMTGIRMRPLTPYSPVLLDSVHVLNADSTITTKKFYNKSAVLLLTVGFVGGEELFTGGFNIGLGTAFIELKNKLSMAFVADIQLEAGFNVSQSVSLVATCTYSYLLMDLKNSRDGFAVVAGIKARVKF